MTGGTSMRAQLDSLSMTVHEVVGRIELSGRQILMLCVQLDARVSCRRVPPLLTRTSHIPHLFPRARREEDRDRLKSVLATQDEILNQKISA
jgi:hypothetical protein